MTTATPVKPAEGVDRARLRETGAAMDAAKEAIEKAVRREFIRAGERLERGGRYEYRLTEGMMDPIIKLHAFGMAEARHEMEVLGFGELLADATPVNSGQLGSLENLGLRFQGRLDVWARRHEEELPRFGQGRVTDLQTAITGIPERLEAHLQRVPGARDIASQMVSQGYAQGLADVYEDHADAFPAFQYSAAGDRATCGVCGPLDGKTYATVGEMYEDLPNFGPNPSCLGGFRCRCRGIPLGFGDPAIPATPDPGPTPTSVPDPGGPGVGSLVNGAAQRRFRFNRDDPDSGVKSRGFTTEVADQLDEALEDIDRALDLSREDWRLSSTRIYNRGRAAGSFSRTMAFGNIDEARITVNTSARARKDLRIGDDGVGEVSAYKGVLFHEAGHALDYMGFGQRVGVSNGRSNHAFERWLSARGRRVSIDRTVAEGSDEQWWAFFDKIDDLPERSAIVNATGYNYSYRGYLLSPHETWARAFHQYMVRRSGGGRAELDLFGSAPDTPTIQWSDESFDELEPLIEDILRAEGVLR
jgi:tetratricopeptide (TPR) repeat protein